MSDWILYGANGYTGELIARRAVEEGLRPILAGRSADAIAGLARELGLEARVFALDDPAAIDRGLAGARAVLHCAGPFSRTSAPMVAGCLRARAHYLDVTGEIGVFSACRKQDAAARDQGVVVLPGVGFDVVPSDCLARALADALPGAARLEMAIYSRGGVSRGTATTMVEHIGLGGAVREDGRLKPIALGSRTRTVRIGGRDRLAVAVPWGDLATAYTSTGIRDITIYMTFSTRIIRAMRLVGLLGPLLRLRPVTRVIQRAIALRVTGPGEHVRETMFSEFWGRVEAADGRAVEGRLFAPEGYKTTVIAALACLRGVLAGGVRPGYHTPATAFGASFVAALPGFKLEVPG